MARFAAILICKGSDLTRRTLSDFVILSMAASNDESRVVPASSVISNPSFTHVRLGEGQARRRPRGHSDSAPRLASYAQRCLGNILARRAYLYASLRSHHDHYCMDPNRFRALCTHMEWRELRPIDAVAAGQCVVGATEEEYLAPPLSFH